MESLAMHLVYNHLKYLKLQKADLEVIVSTQAVNFYKPSRVIAVVGAGASCISGLLLANDAIEILKNTSKMPKEMLDAELERLTTLYRLPHNTFETILMALSSNNFTANNVRDKLTKLYKPRFIPNMFYEILAHLLKHKFIDAIINFNFDELLDQSIKDELEHDEFKYIISDGDCPDISSISIKEQWVPLYIKPHGTISHPSTLRYTHEDYFRIPIVFNALFNSLLDSNFETVLIIAGFNMQSFEFNRILENVKKKMQVFIFNKSDVILNKDLEQKFQKKYINVQNFGLCKKFSELYDKVERIFNRKYKPRGIERHKFVASLFESLSVQLKDDYEGEIKKYTDGLKDYFLQRTVIEIFLNAAKCKGIININELSEEACGDYYNNYRKIAGYNNSSTLHKLCADLGFNDLGYSHEILKFSDKDNLFDESHIKWNRFENRIKNHFDSIIKYVPLINKNRGDIDNSENFITTLEKLHNGDEVELKLKQDYFHNRLFNNPKVITTKTEFTFLTHKLLKNDKLKWLLIIAETGEYVKDLSEFILGRDVLIELIVADKTYLPVLDVTYDKELKYIYYLSWWRHNRHMTIALDSKRSPLESIYFARRHKNSPISPVYLDERDTGYIIGTFEEYVDKSKPLKIEGVWKK
jgi:hypothetical protein